MEEDGEDRRDPGADHDADQPVEPSIDLCEAAIDLDKTSINLDKASIDLGKASINLGKT